jgi:thiamine pyrophosphate-dependent acetolactate synthase large subunit-like protein
MTALFNNNKYGGYDLWQEEKYRTKQSQMKSLEDCAMKRYATGGELLQYRTKDPKSKTQTATL